MLENTEKPHTKAAAQSSDSLFCLYDALFHGEPRASTNHALEAALRNLNFPS